VPITEEQFQEMQRRIAAARRGQSILGHGEQAMATVVNTEQHEPACKKKQRVQSAARALPKTREERLNKTEREFLLRLRGGVYGAFSWIGIQSITLELANNCRYTPDFVTLMPGGDVRFWEVKGAHIWEDGWIKLKMAARLFPGGPS
jgi:hypothetical protein